jgi:aldose 1-epimerase
MSEQLISLGDGDVVVTVLPAIGARVHGIAAFGSARMRTPDDPAEHRRDPFFWGGYHMAPWCNRLAPGPVRVGARTVDLATNFPDGTAIHGQVYAAPWEVRGDGEFGTSGSGAGGWPWPYEATLRVAVSGAEVTLAYALTNTADDPMPAGLGWHPWFRPPAQARFVARSVFPSNLDTPTRPEPVSGQFDRGEGGPLPDGIDACWTDLPDPAVHLGWPDGVGMTMRGDRPDAVVVAANPVERGAAAVEIQTHAPDGLRRLLGAEPYGLELLDPGATLALTLTLSFRRNPPGATPNSRLNA